jgi:hypothetical protein
VGFVLGTVATTAVVCLPFAVSPAPTYYGGASPPALAKTLFSVPWVGGVAFAFAASVVHNLSHLQSGHRVLVGGTAYRYPPAWVFLYWIATYGGATYLAGLATAVLALPARLGERGVRVAVSAFLLGPLLVHTGLGVKLDRYLVPLYPLLALAASWGVVALARAVVARAAARAGRVQLSTGTVAAAALCLLLVASLIPPSFAATSAEESIRTDSGIDETAAAVEEFATAHGSTTVVASNPLVYRWYLGEHRVGRFTKDVHEPKRFQVSDAAVTLVGTKYDDLDSLLEERRPCLVVVSQSWVEKTPASHPIRRYVDGGRGTDYPSGMIVFDRCENRS